MEKVRVLALDVFDKGIYETEVDNDDLDSFYKLLNCDCFDIVKRKIGGKWFDIFCDDEGLFKDRPLVSAIYKSTMKPAIVGNLIFANHDSEGNTTGLSDEDIEIIKKNVVGVHDFDNEKSWNVVFIEDV